MKTFSLITEGVTDQKVLKNILIGYFDDREEDDIRFTYAQPLLDETDLANSRQASGGGWGMVLAYCASEEFRVGDGICLRQTTGGKRRRPWLARSDFSTGVPLAWPTFSKKVVKTPKP